jgi:hypothetical protein
MSIFCILALAFAAQAAGTATSGQVRGVVIDASGGGLRGALVRLVQDSSVLGAQARADQDGVFNAVDLKPGTYTLIAWLQGFRARRAGVVIRDGEITDIGRLRLELAGCDAPGVMCDNFGLGARDRIKASGYLNVKLDCAADLDAGKTWCADGTRDAGGRTTDVGITKNETGVYLSPLNGATVSTPNPPRVDCGDANLGNADVRIDGLGPGDDLCVRTHDGRLSHVFLVDDVERTSLQISLYHVTR